MTPVEFIAKWKANTRTERAACQEHFIDLCRLLDEPTPGTDPSGSNYAFEKGLTRFSGDNGWADVWRRNCFAWEYKKKRGDLDAAYRQLLLYAGPLGNPPLLIVCDIERIIIRTNWTNAVTETHDIRLEELTDARRLRLLKWAFSDPEQLRPARTRQALTEEAAREFAELARRLRARDHDPQGVAHFVNRLVFCMFADDVGLLPDRLFDKMLARARQRPDRSAIYASQLFAAMAKSGGEIGYTSVPWFNGGLFDDATALPLDKDDLALLIRVAELDWAEIDPSILGTLFERGLDPDKRSQLGAHYTDRTKIEMIIDPVIRRPLQADWDAVRARIDALLAEPPARGRRGADGGKAGAQTLYQAFLTRLRAFRVLDPACGSGNFLSLSLQALKDLEHQAGIEVEALGLQREFPQVGPEAMLGIEINPYAAELARVSVWIGHIQWTRRHGYAAPSNPILQPLDTIECRDAILTPEGKVAEWPKADVIVGNPPFLGDKAMIGVMGEDYVDTLRRAYLGGVPGGADLVCYWFENARRALLAEGSIRFGLVATNSIRGGANRRVLDAIVSELVIFDAWADEPWTVDGAAVRVSIVCCARHSDELSLNGKPASKIHADLTATGSDLTKAVALTENAKVAFNGIQKTGPFEVPGEVARSWLCAPLNPNGRPNADVVRPYWNGIDVTRRLRDSWIVDFGPSMNEDEAALFVAPFAYVATHVRPVRSKNSLEPLRTYWWRHWRPREHMRLSIDHFERVIVTPEVAKHRVFVWLTRNIGPDKNLIVISRDDDEPVRNSVCGA
jgi:hypothetical protein